MDVRQPRRHAEQQMKLVGAQLGIVAENPFLQIRRRRRTPSRRNAGRWFSPFKNSGPRWDD